MHRKRLTIFCPKQIIREGPPGSLKIKQDYQKECEISLGEEHLEYLPNGEQAKVNSVFDKLLGKSI